MANQGRPQSPTGELSSWSNWYFWVATACLLFLGLFSGCFIYYAVTSLNSSGYVQNIALPIMTLRTLQVTLGMLMGIVIVFFGVMVSWFGIAAPLSVECEGGQVTGKLATASPGLVLALCGSGIIALAVSQKIDATDGDSHIVGNQAGVSAKQGQ